MSGNINKSTIQYSSPNVLNQEFSQDNFFLGGNNYSYRAYTNNTASDITLPIMALIAKDPTVLDANGKPTLVDFDGSTDVANFFGVVACVITIEAGATEIIRVATQGRVNLTLILAEPTVNTLGFTNAQNYPFVEGAKTNLTFQPVSEIGRFDNPLP